MKNIIFLEKRELKKILAPLNYPCKIKQIGNNIPIYRITFEHKYYFGFWQRTYNWLEYYVCKIQNFFRGKKKKYHEPFKPIHVKRSCMPINEIKLEIILKKNDYTIIEEYLGTTYTAYHITKK